MKVNWETCTNALVYITMYRITHPRATSGKYEVYEKKRGPIDCYSSTLVDSWHPVGKARTLEEAKKLAQTHESAKRDSESESACQ